MTSTPPPPARGAVVGSYELLERLGSGGMGEVWKARDRVLDRVVALKFLNERAPDRFDLLHEARAVSALNHPNIVTVFQVGDSANGSFLAMEFVDGQSLRDHLDAVADIEDSLEISEQIVNGLASAHQRGIIHRDLKPENIMIRADGQVKLLDFGLAKKLRLGDESTATGVADAASRSGELVGTFSYMSPEQARGQQISTSSDVFSLGIVMYELFRRKHPFRREEVLGTLNAIVREEPVPLGPPDAPAPVGSIVSRALQKEPSHRYSSAVEISEPLRQARREWDRDATRLSGALPVATAAPVWARALAAAVLIALGIAGAWTLRRDPAAVSTSPVRSMAVMPFRTSDANSLSLAESLPEDLGSALSKLGFQVASRTSVAQLGSAADARAAAVENGIDGVLDGVVRIQGSSARIYIELVNARTGFQIWSQTFTADAAALIDQPSVTVDRMASQIRAIAGSPQ